MTADHAHIAPPTPPEPPGRCVLVCGSRSWSDIAPVSAILAQLSPSLVISGGARGADALAQVAAQRQHIPFRLFRARWKDYGLLAGRIRNQTMLTLGKPDLVVAFWNGKSLGTLDMINRARRAGVPTMIIGPEPMDEGDEGETIV